MLATAAGRNEARPGSGRTRSSLAQLNAASRLDWSRSAVDSSDVRALQGAPRVFVKLL